MRNILYSLVAVTVLSVALFSSAGTRPALAAHLQNQVMWGETAYSFEGAGVVTLSGSPNDVLIETAVEAEANSAANSLNKTMKLRLSPSGGKRTAVAM